MACLSPISTSSNAEFYRAYESRDSKLVQPEGGNLIEVPLDSSPIERSEDKKGLQSRVIVVLSNTVRNVAIIETIRFAAIVGLTYFAFTSVLLPALGFLAIAAGACALKNRIIPLDAKNLQNLDTTVEEVADQTFSRSPSIRSQTRELSGGGSIGRSRGASLVTNFMGSIPEETPQKVEVVPDVKEAFLGSLEGKEKPSIEQLRGLLGICYSSLHKRIKEMPKTLSREGGVIGRDTRTQAYLERKCKEYSAKFPESTEDLVNRKQKLLENVKPSEVMKIIKELYTQISQEEKNFSMDEKAKHHTNNAKHAGEYVAQLEDFESRENLHFAEDAIQA